MTSLYRIFKTERPLIGMIHFPPLIDCPDHPDFDYISQKMLKEAAILEKSGFDGIIIENNYDNPHTEKISPMAATMFASLARLLQEHITIPFGLNVLWNDYETSLAICASTKAKFFRVPAFVDTVNTSYGLMPARAKETIALRKKLGLKNIAIFADVQVKHSQMVDKNKSLTTSTTEAIKSGADAIIVTGKWTGDAPVTCDLEEARNAAGKFPILIGSGASIDNLSLLLKYAEGIIVGTSLKEGDVVSKDKEINLKPFEATLDVTKSQNFSKSFKKIVE